MLLIIFLIIFHSPDDNYPKVIKVLSVKSLSVFNIESTILVTNSARLSSIYIESLSVLSYSSFMLNSQQIEIIIALESLRISFS